MKRKNPNLLTDQEILDTLREEYYEILPKGCWDFFAKRSKSPSLPYLSKRFKKPFNELLVKAGVRREDLYSPKLIRDKENVLLELKQLAEKLGHTPSVKEYQESGGKFHILIDIFSTYNKAVIDAGLAPNLEKGSKRNITKKELINVYKEISQRVGRPATHKDISLFSKEYKLNDFLYAFGGINQLRIEAGFEPSPTKDSNKRYTKEKIIELLIVEYQKLKRHFTVREINENKNLPSYPAILTHFKTNSLSSIWSEIDQILAKKLLESNEISTVISKTKKAGDYGEQRVAHNLSFLNPQNYRVYNNIILRVGDLEQQIDHLIIGINGIFHLETKNFKGDISIDRKGNWEQRFGGTCKAIENPEGQIYRHEEVLKRILKNGYIITSVLVHANPKCSLHHMERTNLNVKKAEQILPFINSHTNANGSFLSTIEITEICNIIESHIVQNQKTAI